MKPLNRPLEISATGQRTVIVLIVLTTGLAPFSMNVPLPSMPTIAAGLESTYGQVQFILTLYLVALALGQFVYGPLSDRFGRRPVLLVGLGVFILGSLACAAAPSVELLWAGRFVQGFGACAGLVLGRAMLSDLYGRDRAASLIGYVTMAMVVAPMIAPALGGILDELVGWRAGFLTVAAIGVLLLAVAAARLPETHSERLVSAGMFALLRGCRRLLATPAFVAFSAVIAFTSAIFFSFLAGAPYVVVELMGRSPAEYGLWFALTAVTYMLGNFLSGRHASQLGTEWLIRRGTIVGLLGIATLLAGLTLAPFQPAVIFLPMAIIAFGNGLVLPGAIASAVTVRPDLAGAASGLSGGLQMGVAAAATVLVAINLEATATPMAVAMAVSALVATVAHLATPRLR